MFYPHFTLPIIGGYFVLEGCVHGRCQKPLKPSKPILKVLENCGRGLSNSLNRRGGAAVCVGASPAVLPSMSKRYLIRFQPFVRTSIGTVIIIFNGIITVIVSDGPAANCLEAVRGASLSSQPGYHLQSV